MLRMRFASLATAVANDEDSSGRRSLAMTPRRLIVVSYYHPPFAGPGGIRWLSMARYLRQQGHSVTILATDAYGRLPDDEEMNVVRTPDLRSKPMVRRALRRGSLPTPDGRQVVEKAPSALLTRVMIPDAYVISWLPAALAAVRRLTSRGDVDCLVTTSPPESAHLVGLLLGRRRPAWIADFRDGWSFEPLRERFPTRVQRSLDRSLERRVVEAADVVVGAYEGVARDFEARFDVPAHHVSNAWDPEDDPAVADVSVRLPGDAVNLVYTGTFSGVRGRDPAPLLEALRRLRTEPAVPPIRLYVAGRLTSEEARLLNGDLDSGVTHLGLLDRAHALALQRSADALLLLTARTAQPATAKLFEYLAAGKPIIVLAEQTEEAARIVQETRTGVTVPPDDVDGIAEALRKAASGTLTRQYAPRHLERFTYPGPAVAISQLVEEAVQRRAADTRTPRAREAAG